MPKPKKSQQPVPQGGEIILYQTEDGQTRIQCRFEDKAIWLTQKLMGELFQKDIRTINEHLQNIYEEAELDPAATIRKFRIVQAEGSRQVERLVDHYHLNAKSFLNSGWPCYTPRERHYNGPMQGFGFSLGRRALLSLLVEARRVSVDYLCANNMRV